MKDKIFLVWSGSNTIAKRVKSILENEYNYICNVGGNYDNNSQMVSIGDTVIKQMKSCNQAIVIFQNKNNGGISNNLYFELGYVSAMYGMKKVHCVKRANEAIVLPTDFDNSFVEGMEAPDDETFANNIVAYFIERQKLSVDTNKMYLINNRYIMHEMLQAHYSDAGSKCSDYELAQYMLFYMQASIMFQDCPKILDELREFKRLHSNEFSVELNKASIISISILEIEASLKSDDEHIYISDDVFRRYYNTCNGMLESITDDDVGTFDEWAKVILAENLSYAFTLYASNPSVDDTIKKYAFEKAISYGEQCLKYIDVLIKTAPVVENNDLIGLVSLYKAYVYKHIFTASKYLGKEDTFHWLKIALNERQELIRNFDTNSIDSKLYFHFQIEYYLLLLEYLEYYGKEKMDEFEYLIYMKDIDQFIMSLNTKNDTNAYIKKINSQRAKI